MIKIHSDFIGGNLRIVGQTGDEYFIECDLRDTPDWFYWAFCVEGAAGKTLTFRRPQKERPYFGKFRLGYHGPAVSHDLKEWHWLGAGAEDHFTYTFQEDEDKVYFAHHFLYHPARLEAFAAKQGLEIEEFCQSRKGRSVPCLRIGEGAQTILLTARHHACESTGSYVLEGVLEQLLNQPIEGYAILCVPFMDYDGVLDGDQGKNRRPHDHNRDYGAQSIYPETAALRQYIDHHSIPYAFDFHSPWHWGAQNDTAFIVQNSIEKLPTLQKFGKTLEELLTPDAFPYRATNDFPPGVDWNELDATLGSAYVLKKPESRLSFTLETTYFGTLEAPITQENMIELGRCFAKVLHLIV